MNSVPGAEAFFFQRSVCIKEFHAARKIFLHPVIEINDVIVPAAVLAAVSGIYGHDDNVIVLDEILRKRFINFYVFVNISEIIDTEIEDYVLFPGLGNLAQDALQVVDFCANLCLAGDAFAVNASCQSDSP